MSEYAPELLNFDYQDPNQIGAVVELVHSPDGQLAVHAAGDMEYLRFLRQYAIAQIDLMANPDDPSRVALADRKRDAVKAYENAKQGNKL